MDVQAEIHSVFRHVHRYPTSEHSICGVHTVVYIHAISQPLAIVGVQVHVHTWNFQILSHQYLCTSSHACSFQVLLYVGMFLWELYFGIDACIGKGAKSKHGHMCWYACVNTRANSEHGHILTHMHLLTHVQILIVASYCLYAFTYVQFWAWSHVHANALTCTCAVHVSANACTF